MPAVRIPVDVEPAQNDEEDRDHEPEPDADRAAALRWHLHDRTERVSRHHHPDPRHDDVQDEQRTDAAVEVQDLQEGIRVCSSSRNLAAMASGQNTSLIPLPVSTRYAASGSAALT